MKLRDRLAEKVRELCLAYGVKQFDQKVFNYYMNKFGSAGANESILILNLYDMMPKKINETIFKPKTQDEIINNINSLQPDFFKEYEDIENKEIVKTLLKNGYVFKEKHYEYLPLPVKRAIEQKGYHDYGFIYIFFNENKNKYIGIDKHTELKDLFKMIKMNEGLEDILRPKSEDELTEANKKVEFVMNKIRDKIEQNYPENKITDFYYFVNDGDINLTVEFENDIDEEPDFIEDILSDYDIDSYSPNPYSPDPEIELEGNFINILFPLSIIEEDGGIEESIGGAGYSVYGGSSGFGNPKMSGLGGRGLGFGGSANLAGGPNLMYTYSIKPLNQFLQQPPSERDNEEYMHTGSNVSGYILNTNKKIEGQIMHIEEDEDNNIKWYVILDKEGRKRKVDPTTVYLIKPEELLDPNDMANNNETAKDNFYPLLVVNEGFIKHHLMQLAQFVADNFYDLPDGVGIDEMVDAKFPPNVYQFYLENKEGVMSYARQLMGEE